ncbi:MAG: hypothetical protein ACF8NJ_08160 [Phycisphaerales bacterium JB038]
MADMEERLDTLQGWLKDSKDEIGDPAPDPLPEVTAAFVDTKTGDSADLIDAIYDPNESPSLNPVNAGSVLTSYNPSTVEDYASDCATLAHQAHTESQETSPDDDYIGDRLKTIDALLPGYRAAAGIS